MPSPMPLLLLFAFKPVTASVLSLSQLCSLLELATLLIYLCFLLLISAWAASQKLEGEDC